MDVLKKLQSEKNKRQNRTRARLTYLSFIATFLVVTAGWAFGIGRNISKFKK